MRTDPPSIVILAGPNGAGKSTVAPYLLSGALAVTEYVNADTIARGLSAFDPESAARAAGRIMRTRLYELVAGRADFAFETTLGSRSFASWLHGLVTHGYRFHLVFLWLPTPDLAVARVAQRVRSGGHAVRESRILRRYYRGLCNFEHQYRPMATTWRVYDNSQTAGPWLVADGGADKALRVTDERAWRQVQRDAA